MIELEKTYLAKELPDLSKCKFKDMIDIYIPKAIHHAPIRIRKNGVKFEMTKKQPLNEGDSSRLVEQTINLSEEEFNALEKEVIGRRVYKRRYLFEYNERIAEVDVFKMDLEGLILVDFEFDKEEEKEAFSMPSFCLVEVTQEAFIAGGMLCGKSYFDLEDDLSRFNYKKIDTKLL